MRGLRGRRHITLTGACFASTRRDRSPFVAVSDPARWPESEIGSCFAWNTRLGKVCGRIFKAFGRKIQIAGKEIQSLWKQNPSFFLPRIETFQGLGRLHIESRFSSPAPRRRRAATPCHTG